FFNDMRRYLAPFGLVQQSPQFQVGIGIGATGFGADINFTAVFRINTGIGIRCFGHGFFAILKSASHAILLIKRLILFLSSCIVKVSGSETSEKLITDTQTVVTAFLIQPAGFITL